MSIIVILLYFIPAILAICYDNKNVVAIFALNFALGWTVIGWILALVWALAEVGNAKR